MLRWMVPYIPPARQDKVISTTSILAGVLTISEARRRKVVDQRLGLVLSSEWSGWRIQQRQASRELSLRYSSTASSAVNQVF